MRTDPDLKRIEQRTYREYQKDGLMEVMLGINIILLGLFLFSSIFIFYIIIIFFSGYIVESIRKRFTYPRIGYVKLKEEEPKKEVPGALLFVLVIFAILVIVLLLIGDVKDSNQWLKWSPLFFGMILIGPTAYVAGRSGSYRYYGYGILAVSGGLFFSIMGYGQGFTPLILFLLFIGGCFTICGLVIFATFLTTNAVITEDSLDG